MNEFYDFVSIKALKKTSISYKLWYFFKICYVVIFIIVYVYLDYFERITLKEIYVRFILP